MQRALEINPRAAQLLDIKHIEASDNTLTIHTNNPNPALIFNLVEPFSVVVDVAAAESMGDDFAINPVLTGPYKIVRLVKDTEVVVKKNEHYWGPKPHVHKVVFKYIPDANTRIMALQSGEISIANNIPFESMEVFANKSDFNILSTTAVRTHMLIFNLKNPIFQNIAVRKAINIAIDRDTIANGLLNDMGVPAVGPYPLVLPFGGSDLKGYDFNIKEADRLLTEAGWIIGPDHTRQKGGVKLEFTITTYRSRPELPLIAETLQSQLGELGIKVKVNVLENNITDILKSGNFDTAIYSMNTAVTGDPQYFLETVFKTGADSNFGGYSNSELDSLINDLKTAFAITARYALAKEAQQVILDDAAFAFLIYPKRNLVVSENIKGLSLHPLDFYFLTPGIRLE